MKLIWTSGRGEIKLVAEWTSRSCTQSTNYRKQL